MDKNIIYQAFVGYLNFKNYNKEDFEAELVNNTVATEDFISNLEQWYTYNNSFDSIIGDTHKMFSFCHAIKGESYWNNLWNRNTTVQKTLFSFLPKPLTNEDILTLFLKKHRAFSAYKRGLATRESTTAYEVTTAFMHAFSWSDVKEEYFSTLHRSWETLCRELKLTGKITPKSLQNRRA